MPRVYKLYANTTVTQNNVASLQVTKKTTVIGLAFVLSGTGGAGVGRIEVEVARQSATTLQTNNPANDVCLGSAAIAYGNAISSAENTFVPCNIDIDTGDVLYLNTVAVGTGAATAVQQVYVITKG